MTQDEKFLARLKSQEDGLYYVPVVIIDGKLYFWLPPELAGPVEGLQKEAKDAE